MKKRVKILIRKWNIQMSHTDFKPKTSVQQRWWNRWNCNKLCHFKSIQTCISKWLRSSGLFGSQPLVGILLQRWDPISKFTFVSDKSNQNYPFRVDLGRTVNHINRGQPCKFEFTESKELFDFLILFDFRKYRLERPQRVQENFSKGFDTVYFTSR